MSRPGVPADNRNRVYVHPGPVLKIWISGAEVAAIRLGPRVALDLARQLLLEVYTALPPDGGPDASSPL